MISSEIIIGFITTAFFVLGLIYLANQVQKEKLEE